MTTPIERPDINALQALLDDTTPGTWVYDQMREVVISDAADSVADIGDQHMTDADGFFIAAARNAMLGLLAYVRELERSREVMMSAICNMTPAAQDEYNNAVEQIRKDAADDEAG